MTSTRAHAKILSVDISEASEQPGFVDYISKKDVPGSNFYNLMGDDEVFADGKVFFSLIIYFALVLSCVQINFLHYY